MKIFYGLENDYQESIVPKKRVFSWSDKTQHRARGVSLQNFQHKAILQKILAFFTTSQIFFPFFLFFIKKFHHLPLFLEKQTKNTFFF